MNDRIEKIGDSVIQHGPHNKRVYIMKLNANYVNMFIKQIEDLANREGYTKIFGKVSPGQKPEFDRAKYIEEASIPQFYNGVEECYFMSKFIDSDRANEKNTKEVNNIISVAGTKKEEPVSPGKIKDIIINKVTTAEIEELAQLYTEVFKSYPFPIFDPEYLKKTMRENITYFAARYKGNLIGAASLEMDPLYQNAEMTDFAVRKEFRGNNIALLLLQFMEKYARDNNIITTFTIARSLSYGMNITFAKNKYSYSGTLTNNTNISGRIESMNVWYKRLS